MISIDDCYKFLCLTYDKGRASLLFLANSRRLSVIDAWEPSASIAGAGWALLVWTGARGHRALLHYKACLVSDVCAVAVLVFINSLLLGREKKKNVFHTFFFLSRSIVRGGGSYVISLPPVRATAKLAAPQVCSHC